ncbi:ATP-binding protein [Vibrio cholerae]|nr:ATP-binding protein [Vibrio cholerae]MCX9528273.1 ATP-binding protein [Vibrio cholerae]TQQ26848.1 ATP-binding protein [Vibrio cholerae]TQQ66809.1 ATP-binding protein [Vibrio cholerae]HDG1578182.1 ATP-binding protein [Vibrio cholerae]
MLRTDSMALEAGGYAEKLGNRYESNWVAYQLLRLLQEKISYVIVEPIGDDEAGVDLVIGNNDDSYEHHQCKASSGNSEYWHLSKLHSSNILKNASFQIGRGATEFHLVSPLSSRIISDLCESALNSNAMPFDFLEYQVKQSQEREKCFNSLCEYLGMSVELEEDVRKVMLFLQRFKIIRYDLNKHNQSELEDKASSMFIGSSTKLVQFLKYYPVEYNKLRNKITANQLLNDLKKVGFVARGIPEDERVLSVVDNLSKEFDESIQPFLICNQLIKRRELDNITDSLEEHPVTLIRAEAGVGKSSLLLELHNYLRKRGTISVPVRLDRRNPENNLDAYGRALGFPYSPPFSLSALSKHNKVVIILDQLDAIRWTGAHSNIALHICQELIRQTIALRKEGADISIVLASRDFELNEDIALSSWLHSISESLHEVTLSTFDEEIVDELVSPFETYSLLSSVKKEILKIPLWLGIYLTIAHRTQTAPSFNNKLELVKNFWDDRLSQVSAHHLSVEEAEQLIDKLVSVMMKQGSLSVSLTSLPVGSRWALEVLMSVGVLTKQEQRISFRHQALYDYQVGSKLYRAGSESSEKLLSELGEFDNQTLDKREHLRYALNMLLDANQKNYCSSIEAVLLNDKVRFHLKFLALNSLKDLKVIKAPARKLIDKLVNDSELNQKFISTSCFKNPEIIEYLIESGILASWLNSSDEKLVDASVGLLGSISELKPELVVATLRPYVDVSDSWNQKVYSSLCWNIEDDSDEMFELRTELIQKNCSANYVDWRNLSKKHPKRALSLIEVLLGHYKEVICKPSYSAEIREHQKLTHRDNWSPTDLDEILAVAEHTPEEVIGRLLRKITDIAESQDDYKEVLRWLHKDKADGYEPDRSLTSGIFKLIVKAGENLQADSEILYELVKPYLAIENPVTVHLVARLLLNLSTAYSDIVIDWMLSSPNSHLSCGNTYLEPVWILPGKLVSKFSKNCSNEHFARLEEYITHLKSEMEIEKIKWILETRRRGSSYSYWGSAQYFLLPKLDGSRISIATEQLIKVLDRKFVNYSTSDFCSKYESIGGVITSPLPIGNKLSNGSWSNLILTPEKQSVGRKWKQVAKNVISEPTIKEFSRTLEGSVCNEPVRFASFALSLPKDIDPRYISAIFRGLADCSKEKAHEDYKDDWAPCSDILLERVIAHFPHCESESALVRLLDCKLLASDTKVFHLLLNLARHAKDPELNKLNVWNPDKGRSAEVASAKSLMHNSINCVRGQAYIAIAKLFFKNELLANQNRDVVDQAIVDEHPAVKMSALELLKPYLNYDSLFAHTKFIELCTEDIRVSGGYGANYFFNQGFESERVNEYIELVLRMLGSQYVDIRKEAARQIYARWFFNDLFEHELALVLKGDKELRSGCASVLSQFLSEDKYHDRIGKIESSYIMLLNDEDKDILQEVGSCVQYDSYWTKHNSTVLFSEFVKSKAARFCIDSLFRKLEDFPGMLIGMSDSLLGLVKNIVEVDKNDESFKHRYMHIRESSLLKVLQRLYDEATEDEDDEAISICLDIWDELLNSEIYTAMSAVKELDNGLLS